MARGQFGIFTVPLVTIAAARKGPAFERSGSITTLPPEIRPGSTFQLELSIASALTPLALRVCRVISM